MTTPSRRPAGEMVTSSDDVEANAGAALDRFFDHYYARRPVQATYTGVHAHDSALPDWSPDALDGLVADMRAIRHVLGRAGCVEDDRVCRFPDDADLALADGFLEIQIAEHESGHFVHRNPALWTGEAIFSVISLVTREFAPLDVRLEAARKRMRGIPAMLADARRVVQAAPDAWRPRALRESAAGVRLFGESLPRWWAGLLERGSVDRALFDALQLAAAAAAGALAAFARWLEQDLSTALPASVSAGPALLGLLLRRGHWCATPIDTLIAEARDALPAARARLDEQARGLAPGGWPEIQERLADAHPAADEYVQRFERTWRACRDMAIAHDLVTWPDTTIRYAPIPAHTRAVAPALYYLFYRSPAPFDRATVHEHVLTPVDLAGLAPDQPRDADVLRLEQRRLLRATNDSVITLNHVVHHSGLGHHVQNDFAARSGSRVGQVAAVDGASRIGMFSGGTMAEGWACYACDLAEEAGLLSPLESVAQQHTRVRLLARAVADLELHTGRRTLDETAALYREQACMNPEAAHGEALKNSMFPGAAVMYWLGTRAIHDLRRRCQAREGSAFALRAFHDRLLSHGSIPVPLIARLMIAEPA